MVNILDKYVDMAITPQERKEDYNNGPSFSDQPIYPYGLSISLCQDEIEKLNLEDNCEIGDMIDMKCIAKVTSVSKTDSMDGPRTRVELQIIAIAADGEEEDEPQASPKLGRRRPY